jgi:hypothetical protein
MMVLFWEPGAKPTKVISESKKESFFTLEK